MEVFVPHFAKSDIKREFHYAFGEDRYPGAPKINLNLIENFAFKISGIEILPISALHLKNAVFGYRIGNFSYLTDVKKISENEKNKMRGSEIITISGLRKEEHISHFNLADAVELLQELKPSKGYITHISHLMGNYKEVEAELPPNIHLAYDGLSMEIN